MIRADERYAIEEAYLDKLKVMYDVALSTVVSEATEAGLANAVDRFTLGLKSARDVRNALLEALNG